MDSKFRMITKRDILISLIISTCSLGVSFGIMGVQNVFVAILFFIIPLIVTLALFAIFKPKISESSYDSK